MLVFLNLNCDIAGNFFDHIVESIFSVLHKKIKNNIQIFQDSFVVGTDEEESEEEITHSELSEDGSADLDEITIEPIRPNKRKSDEIKQSKVKKRLRIIEMSSDSD